MSVFRIQKGLFSDVKGSRMRRFSRRALSFSLVCSS